MLVETREGMSEADHLDYCKYLDAKLCSVAKRRAALDVEEAALLREAESMKLWRVFGHASLLEYMERAMGYQPHTARERLRVARALEHLPQLEQALATGRVCHSVIREVAGIVNADTEGEWIDRIEGKSCREVEKLVAGHKPGDRPDDPTDPDLRTRRLELVLGPEAYAVFREGRIQVQKQLGHQVSDSDLICILFRRALGAPADGELAPPAYRRSIKTCDQCRRHWENGGGRDIEVSAATASMADCDAQLMGSLDTDQPERMTTTLTDRKRTQVKERDGNCCAVPGCRSAWNLDIHHITWQEHGGGHELSNLLLICGGHHRAIHHGALKLSGRAPHDLHCEWVHVPRMTELLDIDLDADHADHAGRDAGLDGRDAGLDVGLDADHAGLDADLDAGLDADHAGLDAGLDAGDDAGDDAGRDANIDTNKDAEIEIDEAVDTDIGVDATAGVSAAAEPSAHPAGAPLAPSGSSPGRTRPVAPALRLRCPTWDATVSSTSRRESMQAGPVP